MLPKHLIVSEIYNVKKDCHGFDSSVTEVLVHNTGITPRFSTMVIPKNTLVMYLGQKHTYRLITPYCPPGLSLRQRPKRAVYHFMSLDLRSSIWILQTNVEGCIWPQEKHVVNSQNPAIVSE